MSDKDVKDYKAYEAAIFEHKNKGGPPPSAEVKRKGEAAGKRMRQKLARKRAHRAKMEKKYGPRAVNEHMTRKKD